MSDDEPVAIDTKCAFCGEAADSQPYLMLECVGVIDGVRGIIIRCEPSAEDGMMLAPSVHVACVAPWSQGKLIEADQTRKMLGVPEDSEGFVERAPIDDDDESEAWKA